jgi:serine/threonine protein phosphatase PrpC
MNHNRPSAFSPDRFVAPLPLASEHSQSTSTSCRLFDDDDDMYTPFTPFAASSATHPHGVTSSSTTSTGDDAAATSSYGHHSIGSSSQRLSTQEYLHATAAHEEAHNGIRFVVAPLPSRDAPMRIAMRASVPEDVETAALNEDTTRYSFGPATAVEDGFACVLGPRKNQEDNYVSRVEDKLWAVFDGHRGHESSAFAANFLHDHIAATKPVVGNDDEGCPGDATPSAGTSEEACQQLANDLQHLEHSMRHSNIGEATGTTACVATIGSDGALRIANIGDSRAVLADKHGHVRLVTEDHKAHSACEVLRFEKEGLTAHDELSVTRALGDFDIKAKQLGLCSVVDVYECYAAPGDVLILASDGVWDVVTPQDAVDIVLAEVHVEAEYASVTPRNGPRCAAQALVKQALDRRTGDNCTAVVVRFKW